MLDIILIILSAALITSCFCKFSITNLSSLFGVLYIVFYLFPGLDRIYKWNLIQFQLFDYYYGSLYYMKQVLIFNIIVAIFFLAGYNLLYIKTSSFMIKQENQFFKKRIYFLVFALLVSVILIFRSSWEMELYQLFLPSRKQGLITSGYIKLFAFITPMVLAFIAAKTRLKGRLIIYLIGLFIIFISGQRRFILNYLLVITISENLNQEIQLKKYFKYFTIFVSMIPLLWYARSVFSQIQRGVNIADINLSRSISYLIFGSPSSGFETMLFYEKFSNFLSLDYLISLRYIIFSFIPRFLIENKPESISSLVKTKFNWGGNPSIFFTNEMVINFNFAAPIVAFFFGLILAKIANMRTHVSIFCLAGVLTLFKGGFSYYITETVFALLIYYFVSIILKLKVS